MLCSITIRDLAVVEHLELDLSDGLTVLTGETGAGKSILLTAMGLALGDRADSGFIRPGSEKAEISLQFDVSQCISALTWLEEHELAQNLDCCIIRRVLNRDGRSKAFINGSLITLQLLQQFGAYLIDIHGQHLHLSLMHRDEQRRILDEAARNQKDLESIDSLSREWNVMQQRLQQLTQQDATRDQRGELIEFQVQELEQCDIENLDFPALTAEHSLQSNLGDVIRVGQLQLDLLQNDDDQAVNALMEQSVRALSAYSDSVPEFDAVIELINGAQIQIQEAGRLLQRYLDSLEIDPHRLQQLEERLSTIHNLSRKHQVRPEELVDVLQGLRNELDQFEHLNEEISELDRRIQKIHAQYCDLANTISSRRQQAALELEAKITQSMQKLGMPQGKFKILVSKVKDCDVPRACGYDLVEFQVSTNPGLPPKNLAKIASGGELSRISLAIQVSSTDSNTTPTLVFDEVDSGIGGAVAEIVGQRLRALGESFQVLCITHLPQVAAQSHHHLLVEKTSRTNDTCSSVRPLTNEQRQQEIARMLGGVKITDNTLAHAREMLGQPENPSENL